MTEKKNSVWVKKYFWAIILYFTSILYVLLQGGKTAVMLFFILTLSYIYFFAGFWSGIRKVSGIRLIDEQTVPATEEIHIAAGTPLKVKLQLDLPGWYPLPYIIVCERLRRNGGQLLTFEGSFSRIFTRNTMIEYEIPALDRGEYIYEETECSTYDVFGFLRYTGRFTAALKIVAEPKRITVKQLNGLTRMLSGSSTKLWSTRGARETTELNGIRPYTYGDRLSRIHWNATAKTGQWKTKQFEKEALPRFYVILDSNMESFGRKEPDFELAVSVAASLIESGLRSGVPVGLILLNAVSVQLSPQTGLLQKEQLIRHLTTLRADGELALSQSVYRASSAIEPGALALIISGTNAGECVAAASVFSAQQKFPFLFRIRPADNLGENMSSAQAVFSIQHLNELPLLLEGGGLG